MRRISRCKLAHARDDRLAGFFVVIGAEGRIFALQHGQRLAKLLLVGGGLGLDRHADDRLGEAHLFQHDRMILIAKRVAGDGILNADAGDDVAGFGNVNGDALGRVHLEHSADVLALIAAGVEHARALFQSSGIDAHVGQIAVLVVDDLKRQSAERFLRNQLAGDFGFHVRSDRGRRHGRCPAVQADNRRPRRARAARR